MEYSQALFNLLSQKKQRVKARLAKDLSLRHGRGFIRSNQVYMCGFYTCVTQ